MFEDFGMILVGFRADFGFGDDLGMIWDFGNCFGDDLG